nr:hypothetical protein [Mammaliicoccus sp. Marseille-Q6498]
MPKIKITKKLNLPQLIEWAWDNADKVQSESFISNVGDISGNYSTVHFTVDGCGFRTDGVTNKDTFTVEVEEGITEDTKLYLIERYISSYENLKYRYIPHQNKSINSILENNQPHIKATHFYTEVNDELVLIWRDGKLVE